MKIFEYWLVILVTITTSFATSHENMSTPGTEKFDDTVLKEINESYVKSVKPIFQKSCFDCHSSMTNYPWYSKLPIARQLINSDLEKAKEHLDITADFPFLSHGSPIEDLKAIEEEIKNNKMPPLRYRLMHWNSRINGADQKVVFEWIQQSLIDLRSKTTEPSHK